MEAIPNFADFCELKIKLILFEARFGLIKIHQTELDFNLNQRLARLANKFYQNLDWAIQIHKKLGRK